PWGGRGGDGASAARAPWAISPLVRVVLADLVFTLDHLHRVLRPECERIDRACGPAPAVLAVVVAGPRRIACHDDLDGTAVALPFVPLLLCAHEPPFACRGARITRSRASTEPRRQPSWRRVARARRAHGERAPRRRCARARARPRRGSRDLSIAPQPAPDRPQPREPADCPGRRGAANRARRASARE